MSGATVKEGAAFGWPAPAKADDDSNANVVTIRILIFIVGEEHSDVRQGPMMRRTSFEKHSVLNEQLVKQRG